jgi:hypothetical protein
VNLPDKISILNKYAEITNMENKEVNEKFGTSKQNVLKVLKYFVREELEIEVEKEKENKPKKKSSRLVKGLSDIS